MFYRRHYEFISKYDIGLKPLVVQGLSKPEFYGDLVYNFRKLVGKPEFSDYLSKIVICYKRKRCNIDVIKQSACLAINPITVDHFIREGQDKISYNQNTHNFSLY